MSQKIVISSGDYNGIGPEVILKTLQHKSLQHVSPVILGNSKVFDYYQTALDITADIRPIEHIEDAEEGVINLLRSYGDELVSVDPGAFTKHSGKCAMLAVERGIELCKSEQADALVTAPISKEAVNLAGYHIPGHTEFLAEHTDTSDFMMMLCHDDLRVGLATVHVPLAEVRSKLSKESIAKYINILKNTLQRDFNIAKPHIAVLGLNPHAGDGGIIGKEELEMITPVIEQLQAEDLTLSGPHPADGFFGNRKYKNCDAVLAMYHDQGLIPFKTLSFGAGVNFTAGLPIIRTSPDHGTAFDISGQNQANPSSFTAAFELALQLSANRKQKQSAHA